MKTWQKTVLTILAIIAFIAISTSLFYVFDLPKSTLRIFTLIAIPIVLVVILITSKLRISKTKQVKLSNQNHAQYLSAKKAQLSAERELESAKMSLKEAEDNFTLQEIESAWVEDLNIRAQKSYGDISEFANQLKLDALSLDDYLYYVTRAKSRYDTQQLASFPESLTELQVDAVNLHYYVWQGIEAGYEGNLNLYTEYLIKTDHSVQAITEIIQTKTEAKQIQ